MLRSAMKSCMVVSVCEGDSVIVIHQGAVLKSGGYGNGLVVYIEKEEHRERRGIRRGEAHIPL